MINLPYLVGFVYESIWILSLLPHMRPQREMKALFKIHVQSSSSMNGTGYMQVKA